MRPRVPPPVFDWRRAGRRGCGISGEAALITGKFRQKSFQSPPSMEHPCLYRVDGAIYSFGNFLTRMAKVIGQLDYDPLLYGQPCKRESHPFADFGLSTGLVGVVGAVTVL